MPGPSVFFGTPEFAVPSLDALLEAGEEPALVVSQPARPAGRHRRLEQPPVAVRALELGLELDQPERVDSVRFLARLRALEPEVCVVVAFGQILPEAVLTLPRLGCVNLHASLLPRHRGAAPIQAAIAAGDDTTGVTTMLIEPALDSGPILLRRELPIGARETAGELSRRLARLGAELLVETIGALRAGTVTPRRQADDRATYARRLRRDDGRIDWAQPAVVLERRVRAYDPWPGTFTTLDGEVVKVLEAGIGRREAPAAAAGEIVEIGPEAILVACGDGACLALHRVQRPGRRPVSARELANGMRLAVGERLGAQPA